MSFAMFPALMRIGLWTVLIVLLVALAREGLLDEDSDLAVASGPMIEMGLMAGGMMTVTGAIMYVLQRLFGSPPKGRCASCRRTVPKGDIYCRIHLRQIVYEEDDREHQT